MTISPYGSVLSTAQEKLNAAIKQIRCSIPHSGEAGMLIEQQFRSQLEEILPEKVGVSHGFVVDSSGGISRQMDIILYDRLNTPRIFASKGTQIFPVETTYACGEIKTKLDSLSFKDSFEKCLSYKNLSRKAYFERFIPITDTYFLFGHRHKHWQSMFFCLAFESVSTEHLQRTYNKIVTTKKLEINKRIDTVIALNVNDKRNCLINVSGQLVDGMPSDNSVSFIPKTDSRLCTYLSKEPWSLFIMLLLPYMVQTPTEAVNMLHYGKGCPL